jgi:hypothetical protein
MINSISSSSQVAQSHQIQQQQQSAQTHKNAQNDKEPQDTVVLSKKASESTQARDADHDGDSH